MFEKEETFCSITQKDREIVHKNIFRQYSMIYAAGLQKGMLHSSFLQISRVNILHFQSISYYVRSNIGIIIETA